jgi:hypothetical protein
MVLSRDLFKSISYIYSDVVDSLFWYVDPLVKQAIRVRA